MPLLVIFILVPLLEIYLLLKVGGLIGVMPTLLVIVVTAIAGTWLLRQQGRATLRRYQNTVSQGKLPAQEMIEGFALLFGGALLLTPGFFTDFIGLLCLLPITRQPLVRWLMSKAGRFVMVQTVGASGFTRHSEHKPGDNISDKGRIFEDPKHSSSDKDK